MSTKNHPPPSPAALECPEDVNTLRKLIGPIRKIGVNSRVGAAAASAVERLEGARINATANIGETSIAIVESTTRAAMVGQALPTLGALVINMKAAAASVDAGLSSGTAAEEISHMEQRRDNIATATALHEQGAITEAELIQRVANVVGDAEDDIRRSRNRMALSKETVDELYQMGLSAVYGAKKRLS